MKKRLWESRSSTDPSFYLARYEFPPNQLIGLHIHEYAEIALIESGDGKQILNGSTLALKSGDIFLIRPEDCHSIESGKKGLLLANLAFPLDHAIDLENRYLPDRLRYFRSDENLPWSTRLDDDSYAQIENLFKTLHGTAPDRFELDRALMNIFAILRKPYADLPLGQAPDWLRHACAEMHQPAHLIEGVPALVRFAGRSPEHTARVLREHSGSTPTEFVNRLRIEHAARLLCTTDKNILETALDSGFENQGYFHRSFKARFGTTPLAYRKKHHALIS